MTKKLSRRDFIKLAGTGAATSAVLTGCGPAARYVRREPYQKMPEYTYNGESTYYATTCRECAAGCGIVVRTVQGRAIKIEGNPEHPVNLGKTCARGQASLQGLYNPDRVTAPLHRLDRGSDSAEPIDWDSAIDVVAAALQRTRPSEMAFLLGPAPDHIHDLIREMTEAIGAPLPLRFGGLSIFESRATLVRACEQLFGQPGLPHFDIGGADVVVSFGANFLETWLSPVAMTRGFAKMRRGDPERRGYFVQLEPRLSQTAAKADEWIPIRPGSEARVAQAIGRIVSEVRGEPLPRAFALADVAAAAEEAGVDQARLQQVAERLARAERGLVIPGATVLGQPSGLVAALSIMALNASAGAIGRSGGVSIAPAAPAEDQYHRPASAKDVLDLIVKMRQGGIKALFVHGTNPIFELPQSLGFQEALESVELIVSFATFPDETSLWADYVLPDHHPLESWGYQRVTTGTRQSTISGAQPVVSPLHNTRAIADVLLAAGSRASGALLTALPFTDELQYIQSKVTSLAQNTQGSFEAAGAETLAARFQQHGGWWALADSLATAAVSDPSNQSLETPPAAKLEEGEFYLLPFVSPTLADAGANKPWLQEIPDPMTTVMWNSWVEMNPATAHELGIENDDVVLLLSEAGAAEAPVYLYPAIRPDVVAVPYGQGHTRYGRYAANRGVNPLQLLLPQFNEAGDLAFASMKVRITKTGRKQPLSRLESRIGVYGEGLGDH